MGHGGRSMKVLHVSGPAQGGIACHIQQLQKGLAPLGVSSQVAKPVTAAPGSILKVYREIKKGQWDLVHCHGFQGGAVGRAAAAMAGVPAIVTIHNTLQVVGPVRLGAKLAESWMREKTAWWVTVSSYLRNYAWKELGIPEARTAVIANGVQMPAEIPPWQQQPVLGIVARLIPAKGIDIFIRAVQLLRPEIPDLKAVIIGDGPSASRLKALTEDLGLGGTVEFLGYREDVGEQLKKIAVFVLPTRSEGLGISVLEAMSMGVPVIATAVGGIPELVRHNHTGILVRRDDYGAIARSVRQLLRDKERAEAMRRAAFDNATRNFSSESMFQRTLEIYQQVVNE